MVTVKFNDVDEYYSCINKSYKHFNNRNEAVEYILSHGYKQHVVYRNVYDKAYSGDDSRIKYCEAIIL